MSPRIPKGDGPSIAFFFLVMLMMVCLFVGVFVGIQGFGELLGTLMWVGVR